MKFKWLNLYSDQLENQKAFFKNVLGFEFLTNTKDSFSLSIGWTILKFSYRKIAPKYHYCFLIPSNKLDESINWLKDRLDIVISEDNKIIQHFENWNARSTYFYDGNGNLAEFIVRYDLNNESNLPFDLSKILCVNEIGLVTTDIRSTNEQIESTTASMFWKGGLDRFGTNGTQNGIFLMVNPKIKKTWFPTQLSLVAAAFKAIIDVNENQFQVVYEIEKLDILKL